MSSQAISHRFQAGHVVAYATLALVMSAAVSFAAPAKSPASTARSAGHGICSTPIQHPLIVRAEALGLIERGVPLRIRVTTTATRGLDRGVVRLKSSGGAVVVGASSAALGSVPAGGQTTSEFTVMVPADGHRFLLQFEVRGEGGSRNLTRGATLNLMPDGPAERMSAATTATGDRLLEVRARRIDR